MKRSAAAFWIKDKPLQADVGKPDKGLEAEANQRVFERTVCAESRVGYQLPWWAGPLAIGHKLREWSDSPGVWFNFFCQSDSTELR